MRCQVKYLAMFKTYLIINYLILGDCNGLGSELPPNLDIVGRISPETVWDYIGKMKCSNSKIISIVRLNAINVEEKMPYLALYSYLSSRNRLGVVKTTNKAVKDFYILPLASQKPIPQALLPLNGPGNVFLYFSLWVFFPYKIRAFIFFAGHCTVASIKSWSSRSF
jgi:hypothetical protein